MYSDVSVNSSQWNCGLRALHITDEGLFKSDVLKKCTILCQIDWFEVWLGFECGVVGSDIGMICDSAAATGCFL